MILIVNLTVNWKSKKLIYYETSDVPSCYTGIVLGAFVFDSGTLSVILQERVDAAIELYKANKIKRFLLSGDHGNLYYDEVNSMKLYLISEGIDSADIFLDHAGFDTYSSMYRAKEIFLVDDAIVISQEYHLPRAVFIANQLGLTAYGFIADQPQFSSEEYSKRREIFANVKACFELLIRKKPKFLGDQIPITERSDLSYD